MDIEAINKVLAQHSPDESMREAQLAVVVRDLMVENKKSEEIINEMVLSFTAVEDLIKVMKLHKYHFKGGLAAIPNGEFLK